MNNWCKFFSFLWISALTKKGCRNLLNSNKGQALIGCRNLLNSNKGQALIELLVLSLALASIIQILFMIVWVFINLIWMEHHLYQAILCAAQEKGQNFCNSQLLNDIKKLNPMAEISSLNFNSSKGELKWRFYKQDFVIRQDFKLAP